MREKGITTATAIIIAIVITAVIVAPVAYLIRAPPAPPGPPELKAGFITTSDETDMGWSRNAVLAAEHLEDKYGYETHVTRFAILTLGDTPRMIRDYIAEGYNLIWLNGAEFTVYMEEPALEAPDVKFIAINPPLEEELPPNVLGVHEMVSEACYLAGIVSAYMTETKHVGHIIGENYIPLHCEDISFREGVKRVDPTIEVHMVYAGTWVDAALGYELAISMIEELNVDIIMQCADVTGRGVISACEKKGVWIIGTDGDQSPLAPEQFLTSAVTDYSSMLDFIVDNIIAQDKWDEYAGEMWEIGIACGTTYLAPFGTFIEPLIPDECKAELEEAKADFIEGRIAISDFVPEYGGYPKIFQA